CRRRRGRGRQARSGRHTGDRRSRDGSSGRGRRAAWLEAAAALPVTRGRRMSSFCNRAVMTRAKEAGGFPLPAARGGEPVGKPERFGSVPRGAMLPLVPSPLAGEGAMVLSEFRMGEGCGTSYPSPILIRGSIKLPSPARGEGAVTSTTPAAPSVLP